MSRYNSKHVCMRNFKLHKIPADYWPHFIDEENKVLIDLATEMKTRVLKWQVWGMS